MSPVIRQYTITAEDNPKGDSLRLADDTRKVVGRAGDVDLRTMAARVAPRHAAFFLKDGEPYVVDLGTPYGTFVNFSRIGRETRLRDGDVVRLGPDCALAVGSVEVEVPDPYASPPAPDAPPEPRALPSIDADDVGVLAALCNLISRCAAAGDRDKLLQTVLAHLEQTVPAQRLLVLVGTDPAAMKVAAQRQPHAYARAREPVDEIIGRALGSEQAAISFDGRTLCAGMHGPGVLYLDTLDAPGQYTAEHGQLVKTVALITGLCLDRLGARRKRATGSTAASRKKP